MRIQMVLAGLAIVALCPNPSAALPRYGAQVDATCTSNGWAPARPFNPNNLDGNDPSQVNCGLCHVNAQRPSGSLTPAGDQFRRSGYTDVSPFCSPPPTNQPPRFDAVAPQVASVGHLLRFPVSAADPEGGMLLLTVSNAPAGHAFVDHGDGTAEFSWTPSSGQLGTHRVTFHATDTGTPMAVASLEVTITVGQALNQPPVLTPIGDQQVDPGVALSFTLSAQDPDGDGLGYGVEPLPAGAVLSGALFSWTPDASQAGNHSVTFSVTDDGTPPAMDSETLVISVGAPNRPPRLAPIGARSVPVGTAARIVITASDPDGGAPRIECTGLPADATLTDHGDGTAEIAWSPLAVASYTATCSATDAGVPPEMATETFALAAVEAPPATGAGAPVLRDAYWTFADEGGSLRVAGLVPAAPSASGDGELRARREIRIYAVLGQGARLLLAARQTHQKRGRFELSFRPFLAPCAVAAEVDGVLGEPISVRNAPAGCDSQLLMRVKAELECGDSTLHVEGRRAALGGLVVLSDAATGAELASIPVTRRDGSFEFEGTVAAAPLQLEVRMKLGDLEWLLEPPVAVRQGDGCAAGDEDEEDDEEER